MHRQSTVLLTVGILIALIWSPAIGQWTTNPESNTDICRETGDQTRPLVLADGSGGAIIVWQDARTGAGTDIYAQHIDAYGITGWTDDGIAVCTADSDQTPGGVLPDGSGGAFIVWVDRRAGNDDLYAQRIDDTGAEQWAPGGVVVSNGPEDANHPALSPDGAGGLLLVWTEERTGTARDIYAQRLSSTGTPHWTPGGVAVCAASLDQSRPGVVADGSGGALIVWEDDRTPLTALDIYAQRLDSSGLPGWTPDGIPVATAAEDQSLPAMAPDGGGGAILVWTDARSGLDDDIYAQRLTGAGAALWTPDGISVCNAAEDQVDALIIPDGSGGAIITWTDARNASPAVDVYAQRIQDTGVSLWTPNGLAVCTATGSQNQTALVSDGAGGAVLVWHDTRSAADEDIYAQRVTAAGSLQWPVSGIAVSTARDNQTVPSLAADGNGGGIIAWQDPRQASSRGFDIYAQKLNADGTLGLPSPEWTSRFNNGAVNKVDGMGFKIRTAAKLLARPLVVDERGNSYVTGYSDGGTTKLDYLTVKYDLNGVLVWSARYNGTAGKIDKAYAIAENDGEIYVTGESQGIDTKSDIVTVKYNALGVQQWVARYHYALGGKKEAGLAVAFAGGEDVVVVTGESDGGAGAKADMITVAYDALTGVQRWLARYNGPGGSTDRGYALETFSLPGGLDRVVVTGESDGGSGAKADYATILYDITDGTPLWTARYNGPSGKKDYAYAVKFEKRSDVIYVTGASEGTTKFDYTTIQYDLTGTPVWTARYDNPAANKSDLAYDLTLGDNDELYVTGTSEGTSKYDYATVKYLVDGTQLWVNRYDGGIAKKDIARSVAYDSQNEKVFVTGSSEQGAGRKWDYLTIRIDGLTGLTDITGRYNGPGLKDDHAFAIAVRPGGGSVILTGSSIGSLTKADYATIQGPVDSSLPGPVIPAAIPDGEEEGGDEWIEEFEDEYSPESFTLIGNYPNPFNPRTTITYWLPEAAVVRLTVYDLLGREVAAPVDQEQDEGLQMVSWDATDVASGVYFYRLEVQNGQSPGHSGIRTGKMLLMK